MPVAAGAVVLLLVVLLVVVVAARVAVVVVGVDAAVVRVDEVGGAAMGAMTAEVETVFSYMLNAHAPLQTVSAGCKSRQRGDIVADLPASSSSTRTGGVARRIGNLASRDILVVTVALSVADRISFACFCFTDLLLIYLLLRPGIFVTLVRAPLLTHRIGHLRAGERVRSQGSGRAAIGHAPDGRPHARRCLCLGVGVQIHTVGAAARLARGAFDVALCRRGGLQVGREGGSALRHEYVFCVSWPLPLRSASISEGRVYSRRSPLRTLNRHTQNPVCCTRQSSCRCSTRPPSLRSPSSPGCRRPHPHSIPLRHCHSSRPATSPKGPLVCCGGGCGDLRPSVQVRRHPAPLPRPAQG